MPWEDAEEKKKNQGSNSAQLAYILQVYQPDYERIKTLCQIAKQRKLWLPHWGNKASPLRFQRMTASSVARHSTFRWSKLMARSS